MADLHNSSLVRVERGVMTAPTLGSAVGGFSLGQGFSWPDPDIDGTLIVSQPSADPELWGEYAAGSAGDDDGLVPDVVHSTDFTGVKFGAEPSFGAAQGRRVRALWPACRGVYRPVRSSLVSGPRARHRAARPLTFTYLILSFCSDNKSE